MHTSRPLIVDASLRARRRLFTVPFQDTADKLTDWRAVVASS
jgi:hypothetical protein